MEFKESTIFKIIGFGLSLVLLELVIVGFYFISANTKTSYALPLKDIPVEVNIISKNSGIKKDNISEELEQENKEEESKEAEQNNNDSLDKENVSNDKKPNNNNKSNSEDSSKPNNNNNNNNNNNPESPNQNENNGQHKENEFTATFNKNGATAIGINSLNCKTTSSSCTVTAPSITRSGFTILGWSTSTTGTNIIKVGEKITLTKNETYYAITKENATYIDASSMVDLINKDRTKVGIGSLTISESLTESAKIRAKEICILFSHTRPDGSEWHTVNVLAYGENIAAGNSSISATYNQWFNSQRHKENMLREVFKSIGVVGYYCPSGPYKYYWVQLFGIK